MKYLIGVCGKARNGKDTIGDYLQRDFQFQRYAFADPLKRACMEMFGIPLEDFYDDQKKEEVNKFWGFSPRQMAQLLGTEGGRQLFRDDIWVKRCEMEYNNLSESANGLVITDVRFENEATWVREMGGTVVHVIRPSMQGHTVGEHDHASERGVEAVSGDITLINDGTLDDLSANVSEVMAHLVLNSMEEYKNFIDTSA